MKEKTIITHKRTQRFRTSTVTVFSSRLCVKFGATKKKTGMMFPFTPTNTGADGAVFYERRACKPYIHLLNEAYSHFGARCTYTHLFGERRK